MNELLDKLQPEVLTIMSPHIEKWDSYCTKVEERLNEIYSEADDGITEIMEINPHDNEPLFAAFKMVDSRFLKIAKKMRDAIEKMELTWETLISSLNEDQQDSNETTLDNLLDKMLIRGRALDDGLDISKDIWQIKKQAEWADLLVGLVEKEKNHKIACMGCGADLEIATMHTVSSAACPYYSVVNTVTPPPATLMYYSWGIPFQANISAVNEYKTMLEAEERYNQRSKSNTKAKYKEAINSYWRRYYIEIQSLYPAHPHLADGIEIAVERKVNHATFAM